MINKLPSQLFKVRLGTSSEIIESKVHENVIDAPRYPCGSCCLHNNGLCRLKKVDGKPEKLGFAPDRCQSLVGYGYFKSKNSLSHIISSDDFTISFIEKEDERRNKKTSSEIVDHYGFIADPKPYRQG